MKKDVLRWHAKGIGQGLLPVIGKEPVMAGLQQHDHAYLYLFVTSRGCVERNLAQPSQDLEAFLNEIDAQHLAMKFLSDVIGHDRVRGLDLIGRLKSHGCSPSIIVPHEQSLVVFRSRIVADSMHGEMLERLNRPVSKTGVGVTPPWV